MTDEGYERELRNTSINDVSLADYVKENYIPKSVIEDIKADIKRMMDNTSTEINGILIYAGLKMALESIEKHISGKEKE